MSKLQTSDAENTFAELREAFAKNPLAAAPPALRQPVWRVWVLHQHLFPSAIELAGMIGVFVREQGLTEAEAAKILIGLLDSSKTKTYRFAGDLMTQLCADVDAVLAPRRAMEELRESQRRTRDMLARQNAGEWDGPPLRDIQGRMEGVKL